MEAGVAASSIRRRLHRAVDHIVGLRDAGARGGCELCHADVFLELHHLHYRSFGYEVPSDVMRLMPVVPRPSVIGSAVTRKTSGGRTACNGRLSESE